MRLSINKNSIGFIDCDNVSVKQAEFLIILTSEVPMFELYYTVLDIFFLMVQLRRKKYYPQFKSINEFLKNLDYKNIVYVLQNKTQKIISKLSATLLDFARKPLKLKFKHIKGSFGFPNKEQAKYNKLISSFQRVCNKMKYSNFLLILSAFLLEYFVIFVDSSRSVLCDLIFFFSHAIAPFQLAYNIIYFLPDEKLEFLQESFQQLIVGCLMDKKIFQNRVNMRKTTKKERLIYYVQSDEVEFTSKLDKLRPKLEGVKLGLFEKLKLKVTKGHNMVGQKRTSYFGLREQNKKSWEEFSQTIEQAYADLKTYLWGCQNPNQYMKITFDQDYFSTRTVNFLRNLEFKLKNLVDLEWLCFANKLNYGLKKGNMTLEEYLENLREMEGLKSEVDTRTKEEAVSEEGRRDQGDGVYDRIQLQLLFNKKYTQFIFENEKILQKNRDIIQKGDLKKFFLVLYKYNSKFLLIFLLSIFVFKKTLATSSLRSIDTKTIFEF